MKPPARCPWLFDAAYAHRGLWLASGPPENSMAAFEAASRAGLGVELDIRLSSDGDAMIMHDSSLDRTTEESGPFAARTADELSRVKLKDGGTIPRLTDLLAAFPQMPLLVEMKVSPGREGPQEARVAALLANRAGPTAVMSFNPRSLALVGETAPHIPRGQLTNGLKMGAGAPPTPLPPEDSAGAEISQPDFLSCNIDTLAPYGAPAAKRMALPLITWTVRTPAQLTLARALAGNWIFEALPVESVALAG